MNLSNNHRIIFIISIFLFVIVSGCVSESPRDHNITTIKQIVEEYHESHSYIDSDVYVCGDMARDVWNIVKTQEINEKIVVGM